MVPVEQLVHGAEGHRQRTGRPLVTLTYAQSLDGSITAQRGESMGISGPESLMLTHQLRAAHGAILVGIGTILADDPQLTVRLVEGEGPQPVVLDSRLRMPFEAKLLSENQKLPWIFTTNLGSEEQREALEGAGARVYELPPDCNGHVELPALLDCLGDLGVNSLMVEGGARVITSFLAEQLVDQILLTIAPIFVGGLQAVEDLAACEVIDPKDAKMMRRLKDMQAVKLGGDLIVWGKFAAAEA